VLSGSLNSNQLLNYLFYKAIMNGMKTENGARQYFTMMFFVTIVFFCVLEPWLTELNHLTVIVLLDVSLFSVIPLPCNQVAVRALSVSCGSSVP